MPRLPTVDIVEALAKNSSAGELKSIIEDAVKKLYDLGAWRDEFGLVSIMIFKKGMSSPRDKPTGMRTKLPLDESAPVGVIRRAVGEPVLIEVSLNLFVDELGAQLVKLGATKDEVAFHFLAHESHHIDEIERQSDCGILYKNRESSFAGAARPDFPPDWKQAVQGLTEQYSGDHAIFGSLLSAADVANEAAADLVGLYWMKRQGLDWREFGKHLVAVRKAGKTAAMNAIDEYGKKNCLGKFFSKSIEIGFYDIHEELELMIGQGLPDLQGIYSACWNMAREKALKSGEFRAPSRERFRELATLVLPTKAAPAIPINCSPTPSKTSL